MFCARGRVLESLFRSAEGAEDDSQREIDVSSLSGNDIQSINQSINQSFIWIRQHGP